MATERDMLRALLDDERLSDDEREAFKDMSDGLEAKPRSRLSERQHAWVERKFEQLDLGAGDSLNLHSSGKVPRGLAPGQKGVVLPWEQPGYKKPSKPPGRT